MSREIYHTALDTVGSDVSDGHNTLQSEIFRVSWPFCEGVGDLHGCIATKFDHFHPHDHYVPGDPTRDVHHIQYVVAQIFDPLDQISCLLIWQACWNLLRWEKLHRLRGATCSLYRLVIYVCNRTF